MLKVVVNMKPSKYQQAVFDFATKGSGSAVIQAVAGSGKTTTLVQLARLLSDKVCALAFNKNAAENLAQKMPPHVTCATLNSVGHRALNAGRRLQLDAGKSRRIIKWLQERGEIKRWLPVGKIAKVVSLAKAEGIVPDGVSAPMTGLLSDTADTWTWLLDHYCVDTDERITEALLVDAARKVLRASIEWSHKIIDFDDQLYVSALMDGVTFQRYPWLFVDELQDVSGLQRAMILSMVRGGGRFVGVGDRAQAIYGFRGADVTSMDKIRDLTHAEELPLSICYRCPKEVIKLAKQLVPQIEAADGAEDGTVEHRNTFKAAELQPGHLVVCRNRAPMTKLAYKLLGAGQRVAILGRNSGEGLVTFIEGLTTSDDVSDMLDKLDAATNRAIARARKISDDAAEEDAIDRQETIRAIAEGTQTESVARLCAGMRDMFSGDTDGKVMLGTIHSVKGLEADDVWFLDPDLLPSRGAKKDWQLAQEKNLEYVALTRARKALRFIASDGLR